jgi:hypothetical protein
MGQIGCSATQKTKKYTHAGSLEVAAAWMDSKDILGVTI